MTILGLASLLGGVVLVLDMVLDDVKKSVYPRYIFLCLKQKSEIVCDMVERCQNL